MTPLLSTRDVAEILGMSEDFVRDHSRALGGIRLGGRRGPLKFTADGVQKFIDSHQLRAPEQPRPRKRRARQAGGVELLPRPEGP